MDEHEDRYSFPQGGDPPSPVTEPSGSLFPAVVAGLVAAIVGGVVWGLIVKISDYEVGIVAWGSASSPAPRSSSPPAARRAGLCR